MPHGQDQVMAYAGDEVVDAAKPTTDPVTGSVRYGEDLMAVVDKCEEFKQEVMQYQIMLERARKAGMDDPPKPTPDYMFDGKTVYEYLMDGLKRI